MQKRPYARYKKRGKKTRKTDIEERNRLVLKYRPLAIHWAEYYQKKTPQLQIIEELIQQLSLLVCEIAEDTGADETETEELIDRRLRCAARNLAAERASESLRSVSLEQLTEDEENPFDATDEIHDDSFADEETEMFDRLSLLLDRKEMRLAELLYSGCSARQAAKRLRVSHTAVNRRIKRLREKLAPWKNLER